MAVIQQLDPIYVDVTQSSAELLKLRRDLESGRCKAGDNAAKVKLTLEDGSSTAGRQAGVLRSVGRPDHRFRDPARRVPQP
jgi:hypothetical protein